MVKSIEQERCECEFPLPSAKDISSFTTMYYFRTHPSIFHFTYFYSNNAQQLLLVYLTDKLY